jgi:hypothetical protein
VRLTKIGEILLAHKVRRTLFPKSVSQILNIDMLPSSSEESEFYDRDATHAEIQAKLIMIGSYLGYRTFTADRSRNSRHGKLGDLCAETQVPKDYLAMRQIGVIKNIDVLWFDQDGMPTHCFEVEHTTDVTKGLLRLYQTRKLRINMHIIALQMAKTRFDAAINRDPFYQIREEYVFKTYTELDQFLGAVRRFTELRNPFQWMNHAMRTGRVRDEREVDAAADRSGCR